MKAARSSEFKRYLLLWVYIVIISTIWASEDVFLKCDEMERAMSLEYQDMYCTVTNLHVTHSQEVKISNYQNFQTIGTKFMKFYDSNILYIPHKLFEIFTNLKNLDVAYSGVIDIPRNTFTGADNLSYLNVSHNSIEKISTSIFIGAHNLLRIDLSYNNIATINEFAFKGLVSLDRLALSNNQITLIDKNLFQDNLYLESIALDNNLIEVIEPELFNKLVRLRDVDLTNNRLKFVDSKTFQNAYTLESLMLSGNYLKDLNLDIKNQLNLIQLDGNMLSSLVINATKFVRANNNKISSITALSPQFLEKLYLSNNSIINIQNITNYTQLNTLDLSYNNIGLVNITTFDKLKRLKTLRLRNTNIKGVNFGTFSKQTNLETLDLSYNNLGKLNLDIFMPYLSKLQEFYVDGNNLTEIRGKMISYAFPGLSTIGLSNNNFNCSYLHHILTPPYLSTFVKLHVETESAGDNVTHIRGISCRTDKDFIGNTTAEESTKELGFDSPSGLVYRLKLHETQLILHLTLMKAFVGILCASILCYIAFRVGKVVTANKGSLIRSIAYRSTATVSTNMDI